MRLEHLQDSVLAVLSATERALTPEEIRLAINPQPDLRAIRVALRELAAAGDLISREPGKWLAAAPVVVQPVGILSTSTPTSNDFRKALLALKQSAQHQVRKHLTLSAGELHRIVGGYPGPDHRMPVCCNVMRQEMRRGDEVLDEPPKGAGASLTIAYRLT
jgi:hypothetical protein